MEDSRFLLRRCGSFTFVSTGNMVISTGKLPETSDTAPRYQLQPMALSRDGFLLFPTYLSFCHFFEQVTFLAVPFLPAFLG